jgi:hypothetical protein
MKRKLKRKNKFKWLRIFRLRNAASTEQKLNVSEITYESIAESKAKGQFYYSLRLKRQSKMNPRQLKKYRKKQSERGLFASRYSFVQPSKSQLRSSGFAWLRYKM